jgi:hypothetical protein
VCIGVQWPDYLAMVSGLLVQTLCADLISVPLSLTNRVYRSGVRVADVMLSSLRSSATAIVNHTTISSGPLLLRLIRVRRTNLTILTTRVQDSFVEGFRLERECVWSCWRRFDGLAYCRHCSVSPEQRRRT